MKVSQAYGVAVVGLTGKVVRIEAALLSGLPRFQIVGLPDTALSESKERVRAAFYSAGIRFPDQHVIVNLSPADIPKSGTGFDLPIAVAILNALAGRSSDTSTCYMGELGLDASIRPVRAILPAALGAIREGVDTMIVPHSCAHEAELTGIGVREVWHLSQIATDMGIDCVECPPEPERTNDNYGPQGDDYDFSDIRGQEEARFALEIAAAGGHHLLMTGSPGVGKTMLASRIPTILPALTHDEALEVAAISSAVGEFSGELSYRPPFVAPHHSASTAALVGGGSIPQPGAISRAHRGVLFLDELPEFSAKTLQALRQPMESGSVDIHRARLALHFPARFQLIGAANPCTCGNFLEQTGNCTCSVKERRDYYRKIGGPIFDRFDISLTLLRPKRSDLADLSPSESSHKVAQRVCEARERQKHRFARETWVRNSDIPPAFLRKNTTIPEHISTLFDNALARGELTMRAIDKILRLAWTLADLSGRTKPNGEDFSHAFSFRPRQQKG